MGYNIFNGPSKLSRNKKGATLDNYFVAIFFFCFAIVALISQLIWANLITPELEDKLWSSDASSIGPSIKANAQSFYDGMDSLVIWIWVVVHLGVIVLVFALRSHPVIYIAGVFLIIIFVYVSDAMQDAWVEIYNDSEFSSVSDKLTKTNIFMSNLTKIEMVMGFLTLILFAGLARQEGFV